MLKEERHSRIIEILKRDGGVEISRLCKLFNVTDATIRRDLDFLSLNKKILRTHGGALLGDEEQISEPSYEKRILIQEDQKNQIARRALELITPVDTIFIDSGTTTYCLSKIIPLECRNVIITNGINIASEIINRDSASSILIGGDLKSNTHSTRGALAEEQLKNFRMDIAFLGANAIDEDGYVYIASTLEVGLKKTVIRAAKKTYILIDSSKFCKTSLVSYAHANSIAGIITDSDINESTYKNLQSKNINIIISNL